METEKIFPTAYLPPVSYFQQMIGKKKITIDLYENYIKQTYRNRCRIYSSNGLLNLCVPVKKVSGNHTLVKDIVVDYSQPWQKLHWRAIESAYSNAPFFIYFRDDFQVLCANRYKFLIDLNWELLSVLFRSIGMTIEIQFSKQYIEPSENIMDLRNSFSPKKSCVALQKKYTQVFEDKYGFLSDLSIIDLLFNEGKYCSEYLQPF